MESVGDARFVTTNWSEITRAVDPIGGATALASLYRNYWPPVYTFVRMQGHTPPEAEDLTQDFFLYLVEHQACSRASADRGRFRSFLLGWLKKFLQAAQARSSRMKRGGHQQAIFLDAEKEALELNIKELSVDAPPNEERHFEWQWATLLISRAMKNLEIEYSEPAKHSVFIQLKPFLHGGNELPSQAEVARRLDISAETLRSHLLRLRLRYRALLREEIAETLESEADIDDELRYLHRILMAAPFDPPA